MLGPPTAFPARLDGVTEQVHVRKIRVSQKKSPDGNTCGLEPGALGQFVPPPGASNAFAVLLPLLGAVVARFAETPKVVLIPEQHLIAAMRFAMVGNQLRGVRLNASAARPLTGEPVTQQDQHTQLLPPRCLVPTTPWPLVADPVALLPGDRRTRQLGPERRQARPQAGQLGQALYSENAKGAVTEAATPFEVRGSSL